MSSPGRLAAAAALCALLAGWMTFSYAGRADRAAGQDRTVVATARPLTAGEHIDDREVAALKLVRLPQSSAPPDAIADPAELAGRAAIVDLPAGSLLTSAVLAKQGSPGGAERLRAGERALTVEVVVSPLGTQLAPGARVDLFASGFGGGQGTAEVLSGAEVLASEADPSGTRSRATLRLAAGQVAAVVRADVFARELRAVVAAGR